MSPGWVALCALHCVLASGCGERAGDPVVRVDPIGSGGVAGQGGSRSMPSAGLGGTTTLDPEPGPIGLCGPCDASDECGDANDACLRHDGESFCGRDCEEGFGCPDGYHCVELDNSRLRQCVPDTTCPGPVEAPPSLDNVREYILSLINAERIARGSVPFESSVCLDGVAQESALDYAHTGEPLGTYVDECEPILPDCACNWRAQAEVQVADYALDWLGSIERALRDDRIAHAYLEFEVSHIGIGFWISGDEAWIALSFS